MKEVLYESIGRKIRNIRRKRRIRMVELTRDASISPGMLSAIEHGKVRPSLKTIHRISQVLDIPLGQFFQTDIANCTLQAHVGIDGLAVFREKVAELTAGDFEVRYSPHGEARGEGSTARDIQSGSVQISIIYTTALWPFVPEMLLFSLPSIFRDWEHAGRVLDSPLADELARKSGEKGLRVLGWWRGGKRDLYFRTSHVEKIEDLQGRRVRVKEDPVHAAFYRLMGVFPVTIEWPQTSRAFEQGIVEGVDSNLISGLGAGHEKTARQVCLIGQIFNVMAFVVSESWWATLSGDFKEVVQEAEQISRTAHWNACEENEQEARRRWTESGCEFVSMCGEELSGIGSAVHPLFEHVYGRERLRLLQLM
ncbi:MAG: TRAP transporter substrate-binding protein DctP [Deltaproteobacteria bacterium]|nr:TRAP transporter substrate-binding protein DctP [Deltaproteobacteria bacterium]